MKTLSDKAWGRGVFDKDNNSQTAIYNEIDVKQFIKDLIKKFEKMELISGDVAKFEIEELAGDKLTK